MELQQLRYFVAVANHANFTRAAEACLVSQPSLSQQIIKLERELGQPLFERLGRTARLTEAGRTFQDHAEQVLRLVEDAKARLTDSADTGRLVIAAIPTIAPYMLPQLLDDFRRECRGAKIEVVEETTRNAIELCVRGEVDLILLALPVVLEHLRTAPLFTEELHLVLPKKHRLAGKPRITTADIADEPLLLLNDTHCLTENALSFCRQKSLQPIVTSRVSQLATLQELVSLGQGLSFVPEMAKRLDTAKSRVYRSLAGDRPERTIGIAWHEFRYQTKLFRRFVDWLHPWAKEFGRTE
ncbi:MAG: LysR family transcriptional regulator [Planctomycetia bacterium]|nr:LysR family transcriptional regulator [Planctomycetia bacterium]